MYMLKHCCEYFTKTKYEARGRDGNKAWSDEQGDALKDLWNFLVLVYSHTLKLVINKRNTNHYSHITT